MIESLDPVVADNPEILAVAVSAVFDDGAAVAGDEVILLAANAATDGTSTPFWFLDGGSISVHDCARGAIQEEGWIIRDEGEGSYLSRTAVEVMLWWRGFD